MIKSYTQRLSESVSQLRFEDLPERIVTEAKRMTIHDIGVAIASEPIVQARATKEIVQTAGGAEEATLWTGDGRKYPIENVAFANSSRSDFLDWEDCSWVGHPTSSIIPVAFAVTEANKRSGKDYITAVAAAYEAFLRVALSVESSPEYKKTHGGGFVSWQIFAAVIAAAKAQNFDSDKINQAIGAAVYSALVPVGLHSRAASKSDIYHYGYGNASYNGVFAAKLAQLGYEGGRDYLDGPAGYWRHVSDSNNVAWYTRGFGKEWLVEEVLIKHWPANMWVQSPLEVFSHIYQEHPFTADEVDHVTISPNTDRIVSDYRSSDRTILSAQFNTAYCFASYIYDQTPGAHWFTEDRLNDEKILALTDRIYGVGEKVTTNQHFVIYKAGSFPEVTIEVFLKDGTVLSKTERYPKGHPRNKTTMEEEYELFRSITAPFLDSGEAEEFIKLVDDLENVEDMSQLANHIGKLKQEGK